MENEPTWVSRKFLDAAHQDQLKQHCGLAGLRDENALESALARPRNLWSYQPESTLCQLAAAYGYALATAHPYTDGNKRTAFIAMYTFLGLNEVEITANQMQVVELMLSIADGTLDEPEISEWLAENSDPWSP